MGMCEEPRRFYLGEIRMRAHHEDCDQRAGGEARGGMPWLVLASTGRLIIEETLRLVLVRREKHRPHRCRTEEAAE